MSAENISGSWLRALMYLLIIGAVFAVVIIIEHAQLRGSKAEQRAEASEVVSRLSQNLATSLTRKAVATFGIAQTVSLLPEISQEQFSGFSRRLASSDSSIVAVSLIRDRHISHIYPFEQNDDSLRSDFRGSAEVVEAIQLVRRQGRGILQGPMKVLVNLDGFIVLQPIFLPVRSDLHALEGNTPEFWGTASVVFAAEPFFVEVGAMDIGSDYQFAVRALSDTGETRVFGETALFQMDPVRSVVDFPLGSWEIAVSPIGGWMSTLPSVWPFRVFALSATIVLLLLVRDFIAVMDARRRDGQRLKAAIDTMPDGFVLYDKDDRLVVCNEKYKEFYPKSAAAMKPGKSFKSILEFGLSNGQFTEAAGREQEWLEDRLKRHVSDEAVVEQELDDGRWLRIIERASPDGSRAGLRVDITELKKNERKLELLLNRNPAIVMSQGRDWKIQTCSDAWTQQFGYSREETIGRDLTEFMPSEDAETSKMFREEKLQSNVAFEIVKNILTINTKSGEARSVELQAIVASDDGEWLNLIAMTDITPIVHARDELERLVENDELTGLMSRRGLQRRFADGKRKRDTGFFLIDLDFFKSVNDGYGHEAGDDLLRSISDSLRKLTANAGCSIRLGGEEFAIIRPWKGWQEGELFAERLRWTIEQTSIRFQGTLISRTASIGFIEIKAQDKLSKAMHLADLAQREAKSTGRNKCLPADTHMLRRLADQGAFITNDQIQTALELGQFYYEVQPIVHVGNDRITGFEALMRWRMPDGEIIEPEKFIEKLHEVLRQPHFSGLRDKLRAGVLSRLSGIKDRYIGFNFILEEIASPGAADRIDISFGKLPGAKKQRILVEISERAFHKRVDTNTLVVELQKLRNRGYLIALDDFGVESSNIQRLQQLPIDIVKLDSSLIREIAESDRQRTTVLSIARMIENLGLSCIVEGVETERQAQVLQQMGLVVQQGYFHARPTSPEELFLREFGASGKDDASLEPKEKELLEAAVLVDRKI